MNILPDFSPLPSAGTRAYWMSIAMLHSISAGAGQIQFLGLSDLFGCELSLVTMAAIIFGPKCSDGLRCWLWSTSMSSRGEVFNGLQEQCVVLRSSRV